MAFNLDELNENQLAPVLDTEGAFLVTAGAGSGKTRLLTHRIAHLIRDKGVLPYHILAITFTNKAANEMKERVERMLDVNSGVWISTFHSMCVKILRRYADKIGYSVSFSIYGEAEKERLVKKLIKQGDSKEEDLYRDVMWSIADAKNKALDPDNYFKAHEHKRGAEDIRNIYAAYEAELKKSNALDFDDLLLKTHLLLATDAEARAYYQDKFRYIHVDEFQDTNVVQYQLIKILAGKHKNVMAVGDEDQSIYGWRGANFQNIDDFKQDFNCTLYKLEQNYRSTKKILSLANKIIAHNKERMEKTLWTENPDGSEVGTYVADSEAAEAEYVISKILRLIESDGYKFSDFAVLLRLNALTRAFEEKCIQYGVPYKITGGFKFYERKEIKDILAYLRLTANTADTEAILRVINFPKRGIGSAAIGQLTNYCLAENKPLYEAICTINNNTDLPKALCKKIEPFAAILNCLHEAAGKLDVEELTRYLVGLLDLKTVYEEDTEENENRKLNIKELLNSMKQFVRINVGAGIDEYLQNVSLYSDTDELDLEGAYLHIATVHSAKGLEFPCVFVVGLEDGVFPISRSQGLDAEVEEERRLAYVAVTRAMEHLFLSYASTRFLYGERKQTLPSRFLTEMGFTMPKVRLSGNYTQQHTNNAGIAPKDASMSGIITKVTTTRNDRIAISRFVPGVQVQHKKFGVGIIASVSGVSDNCYAEIDFETVGRLNLSLNYAPLEIIEE